LSSYASLQKDSTEYRPNHDDDPWSYLPDLQSGKQDEGQRLALIFRALLNETQAQSRFATHTRNIPELGISEIKAL
jgi:hypothetical protein